MDREKRLQWGILGAARVNERLLPAIVGASNSKLVAIASRRAGAAAQTLEKYAPGCSGVRSYDSLDKLLDDQEVQAVYLPMANHEHVEWALKAIQSGKHVLIEKPMALTVRDIEAIELAAKERHVTVMEGFMYRFHPQHARVQEIIDSGLIGEIRSARASYSFMMRPARMYRLANNPDLGGGAMWDIGPYAIHSLRKCFGLEPKSVVACANFTETGADSVASGVFDFGDGKFGHFDVSFERSRRSEYEIIGTKGGIKCHAAWQLPGDVPFISWWTEDGKEALEKLPVADHFTLEIEHFSDCVFSGKTPLLTMQDARNNCRAIVAALQAASGMTRIDLTG